MPIIGLCMIGVKDSQLDGDKQYGQENIQLLIVDNLRLAAS